MRFLRFHIAVIPFLLTLSACGLRYAKSPETVIWRGEILIEKDVQLPRGSHLIIEPGTTVRFAHRDDDEDGWGDASLKIGGTLTALGTPEAPVVFTSAAQPAEPGNWGEIRIDFGGFDLNYVIIEGSTRGLHSHFSRGRIRDSIFRNNVDGTRLGESTVTIEHCLFNSNNGKGYNSRKSRNFVRRNIFRQNQNGVFLFEGDTGSLFEENIFIDNVNSMRLGDFFQGTARARGNEWNGSDPITGIAAEEGGEATVETSPGEVRFAGVRAWPILHKIWKSSVNASPKLKPAISDEGVYARSASGDTLLLGFLDGSVQSSLILSESQVNKASSFTQKAVQQKRPEDWIEKTKEKLAPLPESPKDEFAYRLDEKGYVSALYKSTGILAWSRNIGSTAIGEPLVLGDVGMVAASIAGKIFLLDRASGLIRDFWDLGDGEPSSPVEAGCRVIVVDGSGAVWALDALTLSHTGIRFGEANALRQFDQSTLDHLGPKH